VRSLYRLLTASYGTLLAISESSALLRSYRSVRHGATDASTAVHPTMTAIAIREKHFAIAAPSFRHDSW
jgi:hypothetical protein